MSFVCDTCGDVEPEGSIRHQCKRKKQGCAGHYVFQSDEREMCPNYISFPCECDDKESETEE